MVKQWCVGTWGILLAACTQAPPAAPPRLPRSEVAYERMALFAAGDGQARFRGFDGAAPAGTAIDVVAEDGTVVAQVAAGPDGRFDITFPAASGDTFSVRPSRAGVPPLDFSVRDRARAMLDMVNTRVVGTGSTPNQVLVAQDSEIGERTTMYVVGSGDGTLDNVDIGTAARQAPMAAFPDAPVFGQLVSPAPWNAWVRGDRAYVSLYGQHALAVTSVSTGVVEAVTSLLPAQTLVPALPLDPPADADGDGVAESQANVVVPRNAAGVAVVGNRAFVTLANVLTTTATGRSQYAPGMVAAFELDGRGLPTGGVSIVRSRFVNAVHVVAHPDGRRVLVSSTGALHRSSAGWIVESAGGIEVIDADTLQVTTTFDLGSFAPSKPLVLQDGRGVYVPSILRARVARLDLATGTVTRGPGAAAGDIVLEDSPDVRSIFECASHATGLVACGIFDRDAVGFIDPVNDEAHPWPFSDLVLVAQGTGVTAGLQSMAVRPGRNGVDYAGSDVLVLLSLAARVAALDTRHVLGP